MSSNEWETGCSQSKARADSDTLTPAPQITQQCYLPEDTIKETHQRWVSRAGLPHTQSLQYGPCTHTNIFIESLTNCTWILNSMTHNERAIRPLYRWRWTKHSNAAFSIGKLTTCWFLWPDCRTAGMISGLPAHLNVSTFPPSFLSSISTAHLHHNLSAPISGVAMCDTGWDIFRRLGLSPEPTCLSLLNGAMCACVCVYLLSLMIFWCLHVIPL